MNEERILVVLPRYQYADPANGETHEYTELLSAIKRKFRNCDYFDTSEYILNQKQIALNQQLIQLYCANEYKFLFFVQWGNEIFDKSLEFIRESGSIVVNWATDDSYRFDSFSSYIGGRYTLNITTEIGAVQKYKNLNFPVYCGRWGFNGQWNYPPRSADECEIDVSFIGLNYFDREKYIDALRRNNINVHVYGKGWGGGVVDSAAIPEIFNKSKITLNFSRSRLGKQTKARVFEAIAAGTCLVTETSPDLQMFFTNKLDLYCFNNVNECVAVVKDILNDNKKRDKVALNGHHKCLTSYSYDKLFDEIFSQYDGLNRISLNQIKYNKLLSLYDSMLESRVWLRSLATNLRISRLVYKVIRKIEAKFFIDKYLSVRSLTILQ